MDIKCDFKEEDVIELTNLFMKLNKFQKIILLNQLIAINALNETENRLKII